MEISAATLRAVVDELDAHVHQAGWGQPPRLFALVPTDDIWAKEPELAAELGLAPGTITSVEQEGFDNTAPLDESLERIMWPESVVGAALSVERIVLPPSAEAELPEDPEEVVTAALSHPSRQEVRMVVAVVRAGLDDAVLRLRSDDTQALRAAEGQKLVPQLATALLATFY